MKDKTLNKKDTLTEPTGEGQIDLRVKLICQQCEANFSRDKEYLDQTWRTDPVYKWKCNMCDSCVDIRIKQGLKNLPKVIEALAKSI